MGGIYIPFYDIIVLNTFKLAVGTFKLSQVTYGIICILCQIALDYIIIITLNPSLESRTFMTVQVRL